MTCNVWHVVDIRYDSCVTISKQILLLFRFTCRFRRSINIFQFE